MNDILVSIRSSQFAFENDRTMKPRLISVLSGIVCLLIIYSFVDFVGDREHLLRADYSKRVLVLQHSWAELLQQPEHTDANRHAEQKLLYETRTCMKQVDFWLRYLDPLLYKKINAPLSVEWETEVFEKFEKPYRREGNGLILLELALQEVDSDNNELIQQLQPGLVALDDYLSDSVQKKLNDPKSFYYANRLFLLNLAAIYTTGFECPETSRIVPELRVMISSVAEIQAVFNAEFQNFNQTNDYLQLYSEMQAYVESAPSSHDEFDHFNFIRIYVNPLFGMNQQTIREYKFSSDSFIDFSLNDTSVSIFSKDLYTAQNSKGIFAHVTDENLLEEIRDVGEILFFDPILSGNGKRSCASCHRPDMFFADTTRAVPLAFDAQEDLPRNTPSLVNLFHNHLIMQDGQFYQVEDQLLHVICNPHEMGCRPDEIVSNVLSCSEYGKRLKRLTACTPAYPDITERHILGALMSYLSSLSMLQSPFDDAMNKMASTDSEVEKGFNLFMGKAECASCHFVPIFNGVKPPYVSSEFEVIGVPSDTLTPALSADLGRHLIFEAPEMRHAFRTSTVRNAVRTKPYMHNGVFNDLHQVIRFYNEGGAQGRGVELQNQTLSADSLHLSPEEILNLSAFIGSLTERLPEINVPKDLPRSKLERYEKRKVGGEY